VLCSSEGAGHDLMEINCTKGGYKCTSHSSQYYCTNILCKTLPAAWGKLELLILKQNIQKSRREESEKERNRQRRES